MLSGKTTLAALQETLGEAAGRGAAESRLAGGLRARIADAEAWEARAAALLASDTRAPLTVLEVRLIWFYACFGNLVNEHDLEGASALTV